MYEKYIDEFCFVRKVFSIYTINIIHFLYYHLIVFLGFVGYILGFF